MLQNLSSAAVVIGALRVKSKFYVEPDQMPPSVATDWVLYTVCQDTRLIWVNKKNSKSHCI